MQNQDQTEPHESARGTPGEVFLAFLKLGLTSFGGPIAHLGYFRDELVTRRNWLSDHAYADLVALCQFLPGPASSQVGFALGMMRAGWLGALAAFAAFTLPSALILLIFAMTAATLSGPVATGALDGLRIVAVAIVAQAVWGMAKKPLPGPGARHDCCRRGRACWRSCRVLSGWSARSCWARLPVWRWGAARETPVGGHVTMPVSRAAAGAAACSFFRDCSSCFHWYRGPEPVAGGDRQLHRAGALVFGGGHVVLPLLQAEVVRAGLGHPGSVSCRLRRGAGSARTALHFRGISRARCWDLNRTAWRVRSSRSSPCSCPVSCS